MSRQFYATSAADRVQFSAPATAPTDQGPITMAALLYFTGGTSAYWIMQGVTAANATSFGMLTDSGKFYCENNFGSGGPTVPVNSWFWVAMAKDNGSARPRWHLHNLGAGTAWSHTDDPYASVTDGTSPASKIVVGGPSNTTAVSTWRGYIAATALWNSKLSDAQVEAALILHPGGLIDGGAGWATTFEQASVATAAVDITGNGGNQIAISGTSVVASEPSGWSYTIPSGGSPTVKLWDGSAEQPLTMTVWNGSSEVSASFNSVV